MKADLQKIIRTILAVALFTFPLILLYIALNRYFAMVQQDQEQAELLRAEKKLSQLRLLSNGRRFFAQVFKNSFAPEKNAGFRSDILKAKIEKLKKRFPDSFEFMVWNKSGNLIKELSDNNDFVFIKKRLNQFLGQLQSIAQKSFPEMPLPGKNLSRQTRSFRGLIGPFIPAGKIAESFSTGDKGGCFQLHGKGQQAYGWYRKFKEYSILIFISHQAVHSFENVKKLCERMADLEERQKYFLIDETNFNIYPPVSEKIATQLRLNLKKCQAVTPPEFLRNEKMLFAFQKLPGNYWVVATIPLNLLQKATEGSAAILLKLLGILAIGAFVFHCFFLVHKNPFKSIRYKLLAIFLYTVAVPLMIFSTVTTSYLNEKEAKIEADFGYRAFQMLNRFDQQFKSFILKSSESLTRQLDKKFWQKSGLNEEDDHHDEVALWVSQAYQPFAVLIMNQEGKNIVDRNFSEQISDQSIFAAVSRDLLAYLNRTNKDPVRLSKPITENSILSFSRINKKIRPFRLASRTLLYYIYAVQNPTNGRFEYCLHIMWDPIKMLSEFFRESDLSLRKLSQHRWVMYFPESGEKIGDEIKHPAFEKLLERTVVNGLQLDSIQVDSNTSFLTMAFTGPNLIDSVICVMIDLALVKKEIALHKTSLALMLLLILIFSFSLYNLLNYQILEPIKILSQGVDKVKNCKYSFRIASPAENEFGSLGKSINATLENLEELAIAKVVQEALLPEKIPVCSGMEMVATTLPMTSLGGDYYDYFLDADGNLGVVIADIAGHGIQAALMMAMAKSVFLLGKSENWKSAGMIKNLNQTFCRLRESGIRTMATAAVVEFLEKDQFSLFNAGHCAPVLIDSQKVRFLTGSSFPLGYRKNREFNGESFDFHPGAILVLYTDGIIESRNNHGKMLGPDGFSRIIRLSFSENLDVFLQNLLNAYADWRQEQDDDISFVLIKRSKDV